MSLAIFCRFLNSSGDNLRPDPVTVVMDRALGEVIGGAAGPGEVRLIVSAGYRVAGVPEGWPGAREKLAGAGSVQIDAEASPSWWV